MLMLSLNARLILSFDQDGTLTDSISAVEAAWGKVAKDIGQDPAYVIAATHGKRAVDNLSQFKPHIKAHEMDAEVQAFEESILFFADAYTKHGPGSRNDSPIDSTDGTPSLTPASSAPSSQPASRASSFSFNQFGSLRRPSFLTRLTGLLSMTSLPEREVAVFDDPIMEERHQELIQQEEIKLRKDQLEAWQIEASAVDRSVQILPGVKRMISSIPDGRYAVATSGAKTYGTSFVVIFQISFSSLTFCFVLLSTRLHDACRYYSSSRHHHRRRQASQSRQACSRPLPPRCKMSRLRREELRCL